MSKLDLLEACEGLVEFFDVRPDSMLSADIKAQYRELFRRDPRCQRALAAIAKARAELAAPELLAACEDMLSELQSFIVAIEEVYGVDTLLTRQQLAKHGAAARAEAAIAKAKPEGSLTDD